MNTMKVRCEFCGKLIAFEDAEQVILVLEKNATVNKEFAFRCGDCKKENKDETISKQKIRTQRFL